jgi:hypothetical protein
MKTVIQKLVDTMNKDQVSFTEWFQDNYKLLIQDEKEQIIDAYVDGQLNVNEDGCLLDENGAEQYYNQTYNK